MVKRIKRFGTKQWDDAASSIERSVVLLTEPDDPELWAKARKDEETLKEFTPVEIREWVEGKIAEMRDQLVHLAFADMGQFQTMVFKLDLETDVQRHAKAAADKFAMSARRAIDEIAARYGVQ